MSATDSTLHRPSALRSGHAKADPRRLAQTAATVASSTHRPAPGRPLGARALPGGADDRPANWRTRIASVARQRPDKAHVDENWSPRPVPNPSAPQDAVPSQSRAVTRDGAAGAGRSAIDASRPRVTRRPVVRGQDEHNADRVTKRQLQFIYALARECDVEPAELERHSRLLFSTGVDSLSCDSAKVLIDRLARALDAVA